MDNCTTDISNRGWFTTALVIQLSTCFFGVIGSSLSLWCLLTCKCIQTGMKIQLGLFFAVLLLLCAVAMPGAVVVEYQSWLCYEEAPNLRIAFVGLYTIAVALERNIFAGIAVYRLVAVCFPQKYKVLTRWTVVTVVETLICAGVLALWIPIFLNQDVQAVDLNNPSSYSMGLVLYYLVFLFPIFVCVFAYAILIVVMMVRRHKAKESSGLRPSYNDQVNVAVGALILTNLLLDGPHIIVHILGISSRALAFILIHVVYRLHLALDSFIFIGLNLHYRRKVLRRALTCCPVCANLVGSTLATTTAESSSRRPDSVGQKAHPSCSTQV
ncbi:uncharacterized protein LOC125025771 isoform X1 [Penaeus chinensis]|uniref:uncharacterized protein LOC125025771 isoform X1 n=1 Tax=Penaeus chinensis TaxID=139456 RepID=UPI001FB6C21C|nr:uncharacterized protein LOC125025771 isoform X1 [Penaeus chinensis]